MIKPAYSVSFLLSINIFVWQNVLYFLDAPRISKQSVVAYFMVLYRNFLKELTKSRASAQLGEYVCGSTRGVLEFEPAVLPTAVIKILVVMHTEASERYLMVRCYDDAKDFLLLFSFPFPIDIYKPTQSARHT